MVWVPRARLPPGYVFGPDIADQFLYANQLELIARSHQLAMEGYKYFFGQLLVTVWSAPNYCYRCGNVAAILTINVESVIDFSVFEPRPQHLRKVPEYNTRMVASTDSNSLMPCTTTSMCSLLPWCSLCSPGALPAPRSARLLPVRPLAPREATHTARAAIHPETRRARAPSHPESSWWQMSPRRSMPARHSLCPFTSGSAA